MVEISKAAALCFWRNILKLRKESTRWVPHLLDEEQKGVPVRTARKLLKRFPRYDQKVFMNVIVGDESWINYFKPHRIISNRYGSPKMQEGIVLSQGLPVRKMLCIPYFPLLRG